MGKLEAVKNFVNNIREWRRKKKEEREFNHMQYRGVSVLKGIDLMNNPYAQGIPKKSMNNEMEGEER